MKDFDFTTLRRGDKVKNRLGTELEIIVTDAPGSRPIVAYVRNQEMFISYTAEGKYHPKGADESHYNLVPPKRTERVLLVLCKGSQTIWPMMFTSEENLALYLSGGFVQPISKKWVELEEGEGIE